MEERSVLEVDKEGLKAARVAVGGKEGPGSWRRWPEIS